MRYLYLVVLCGLMTSNCGAPQNQTNELPAVERVVYDLFESITTFNYASIRDHCTDDFIIFEDGDNLKLDDFINLIQSFEGEATISYNLSEISTEIAGTVAWMTLRNKAKMIRDEESTNLEWLESGVLKKEDGLWKLAFYHSTSVKPAEADL